MTKVILDTDTGVDDALAIILALRSTELDVEAITTVSGNVHVDLCTSNVLRVLQLVAPVKIPCVARGCEKPLVKAPFSVPSVHGQDGLGGLDPAWYGEVDQTPLVNTHAVDLMLEVIEQQQGGVVLIASGPLTNVATAIKRCPRTMRKLEKLLIMGGAFRVAGNIPPGAAEFNMFVDPHAADVVLGFGIPAVMVGLDVTHRVPLMREQLREKLGMQSDRVCDFIVKATRLYMDFYQRDQGHDGCYLHDPLAVGVAIDSSFVKMEEMRVYVETSGKITSGMTLPFRHPTRDRRVIDPANVSVCTEVDAERFLSLFFDRVMHDARRREA